MKLLQIFKSGYSPKKPTYLPTSATYLLTTTPAKFVFQFCKFCDWVVVALETDRPVVAMLTLIYLQLLQLSVYIPSV